MTDTNTDNSHRCSLCKPGARDPGRSNYTTIPASTPPPQHDRRLRSRLQDSCVEKRHTQYAYSNNTTCRLTHPCWHNTYTVGSHDRTHTPSKRSPSR